MVCETKNTSGSRSSPACCRNCNLDSRYTTVKRHKAARRATAPIDRYSSREAGPRTSGIAVDMWTTRRALPTCPQRQQQTKAAIRNWPKKGPKSPTRLHEEAMALRGIEWVIFGLKTRERWGLQGLSAFFMI